VRLALVLGLLGLALSGVWLSAHDALDVVLRDQLEAYELQDVLGFESLGVRVDRTLEVRGGELRDPLNGRVVAHVDRLVIDYSVPWDGGPAPEVRSLRGRGGRVLLHYEEGDLGLTRSIQGLIEGIERLLSSAPSEPEPGPAGEPSPLPELVFEDLELVVHTPGKPLELYPGSDVHIALGHEETHVDVTAGPGSGRLEMLFDGHGLRRFETHGLRVSPAVTALDQSGRDVLQRGFMPRGALDLVALIGPDGRTESAKGLLREASVESEHLPFRLGPATIPFDVAEGVMHIRAARLGFDGGEVLLSLEADYVSSRLQLDVEHAAFRKEFTGLIPGWDALAGLHCEDGGSFECHLQIDVTGAVDNPTIEITGGGGFHIEQALLEPIGLRFDHVVGRFDADESTLSFPELSARVCGGELRASGSLNLRDDGYQVTASLEDVDVAQLHEALRSVRRMKHDVAGWLQGEVRARGRLGDASSTLADGQISVRAGNFWEAPTFEAILKALTLSDSKSAHQRVEARFNVRGRQVFVDALRVVSDVLTLAGQGRVDFEGRIDFELVPITVPLGLFGDLLEALQQGLLVNLVVTGTLRDPRVIAMPLSVVTNPVRLLLEAIVGEGEEGGH